MINNATDERFTGYGYGGKGLFCTMRHAAEWANIKASTGVDDI